MGNLPGMFANSVTVAWLIFAIVFFSFPYYMPVTGTCELRIYRTYGSGGI